MATHSCELPPHIAAWRSLVSRSVTAWDDIVTDEEMKFRLPKDMLQESLSLDDFLYQAGNLAMVWFFQRRSAFMSQQRLKQWSRDSLDDYVLLPASRGYVLRRDCFFVSHFWRAQSHPDPDGEYLRRYQAELEPQTWSYIWIDWTCMPQNPRSSIEEEYFYRCLRTIPAIIRNCGFLYFYPPFEPRLWILYEIAESLLTCDGGIAATPDIKVYLQHIDEMIETDVQTVLAKYRYRCSRTRDRQYLLSWLELLVLCNQLHFGVLNIRNIMDHVTWARVAKTIVYGGIKLQRFKGTLDVNGERYTFAPFPPLPIFMGCAKTKIKSMLGGDEEEQNHRIQ